MTFEKVPIKFIHWEFYKQFLKNGITSVQTEYKPSRVVKPGTKITNGLHFRWIVRLHSNKDLILSCIAEEVFVNENICEAGLALIQDIIKTSFSHFNTMLYERTKNEGQPIDAIYTVKDADIALVKSVLKC